MWKDNYVTFGVEIEKDPDKLKNGPLKRASIVWFQTEPETIDGARITDIQNFTFTNANKQIKSLTEIRDALTGSVVVAYDVRWNYKHIQKILVSHGLDLPFPPIRVDVLLADFTFRPGKRSRHLSSIARRWGVELACASLQDEVITAGLIAARMLAKLPDDDIILESKMKDWCDQYARMRCAQTARSTLDRVD